ncbi:MAG: hypothetical protein R6V67_10950 [Spirochaetia bacterium]
MNIEVIIQSKAGSTLRLRYDEQDLVKKGESNTLLPHPWPYGFITGIFKAYPEVEVKVGSVLPAEEAEKFITASRS